jgi:hypothetical protein
MQEVTPSFAFRRGEGVFAFLPPQGHFSMRKEECVVSVAALKILCSKKPSSTKT